jgi:uridine kinase
MRCFIHLLCLPLVFFSLAFKGTDDAVVQTLSPFLVHLKEIAETHKKDRSQPIPIVAIGGCPGVGKTHLAKALLGTLQSQGVYCIVLPLDHFNLSLKERKALGTEWDCNHLKHSELHHCLSSIASGENQVTKPICNQLTGKVSTEVMDLSEIDLILFEGLYALCTRPPLNFFDYCLEGIFLEAEEVDVYRWRWEREQKKLEPRTLEQFIKHFSCLLEDYRNTISYSKNNAHFLIRKDSDHTYHLEDVSFSWSGLKSS